MCGRILKNTHFRWMFPLWMRNCFLNNVILCLCNVRLRSVRPLIKMVVSIVSRTEVCAVKFFEDLGWQTMSAKFTQAKVLVIKSCGGLRFCLKINFFTFNAFRLKKKCNQKQLIKLILNPFIDWLSKSVNFWLSKWIFYVKSQLNLSDLFSLNITCLWK